MRNSQGTEATYRGYTYEQWLALMSRERDMDTAIIAISALDSLSETPEQQRKIAIQIFLKSRIWAGKVMQNSRDSASGRWISASIPVLASFNPVQCLEAIVAELNDCTEQSYGVCTVVLGEFLSHPGELNYYGTPKYLIPKQSTEISRELVQKLLLNLESATARLSVENEYRDWSYVYVGRLARLVHMDYFELPKSMQVSSKESWEYVQKQPLDQVIRTVYPRKMREQYENSGKTLPRIESIWIPHWLSLPPDQRQPVLVLHQIFQDQVLRQPELNLQETLAALTVVSNDEKQKIKLLLAQRLADSDFDNPQDSGRIVWPEILKWCVQTGVFDNDTADRTLRIVNETGSSIAKLVGETLELQGAKIAVDEISATISRRSIGIMSGGISSMGMGMGGMNDYRIEAVSKNADAINKLLEQATLRLADLLELPADVRQFTYRLPGTSPNHERSKSHRANWGGMGSGSGE